MKTIYIKRVVSAKSCQIVIHSEVVEHNDKKFLIYICAENGYPLGFNTNCCIKIMNVSGSWDKLVDNKMIGFSYKNDDIYYAHNEIVKNMILNSIVDEFKNYITTIY